MIYKIQVEKTKDGYNYNGVFSIEDTVFTPEFLEQIKIVEDRVTQISGPDLILFLSKNIDILKAFSSGMYAQKHLDDYFEDIDRIRKENSVNETLS